MRNELLVVGLGNPGAEYVLTRHNIGFITIEYLAKTFRTQVEKPVCGSLVGDTHFKGRRLRFAKPMTYMNQSGAAVSALCRQFEVDLPDLLVVHDDVNLPLGVLRIRERGSDGGHNGVASIIETLGTEEFPRLRIGVGACPEGIDLIEYVLGTFFEEERQVVGESIGRAAEAVRSIVLSGYDKTMSLFNAQPKEGNAT